MQTFFIYYLYLFFVIFVILMQLFVILMQILFFCLFYVKLLLYLCRFSFFLHAPPRCGHGVCIISVWLLYRGFIWYSFSLGALTTGFQALVCRTGNDFDKTYCSSEDRLYCVLPRRCSRGQLEFKQISFEVGSLLT